MRPPGCPRAWRRRPPGHSDCREHRPDPSPTQLQEAEEGEARGAPVGQGLLRAGTSPCTRGDPLQGDRLRSGLSDLLQRTGRVCTAPPTHATEPVSGEFLSGGRPQWFPYSETHHRHQ